MSLSPDRKGRVTASRVGAILGLSPFATADDVLRDMVRDYHGAEPEFAGNVATEWGNANEAQAVEEYEFGSGILFECTGDNQKFCTFGDWLGATPDGIYTRDDGTADILEVKCPYGKRKSDDFKSLSDQPHYFAQIQIAMLCANAQSCHFVQWSEIGLASEIAEYSLDWIDENLPKLREFYDRYLSELDNPAHLEPKRRAIETDLAAELLARYDAAKQAAADAAQEQKYILAELVMLAGESDAEICGRKLTKVVREGSISYAKAIKDLAPDADLSQYKGKTSEFWKLT